MKKSNGDDAGDTYHCKRKLERYVERLGAMRNGDRVIGFLGHLQASGLSTIRVVRYAMRLAKLLPVIDVQTAGRKEIEAYVAELNARSDYKAWTKHAYRLTVKKLFQYLRYGNVAGDTPFPPEVAWIRLRISEADLQKEARVSPEPAVRQPRDQREVQRIFPHLDAVDTGLRDEQGGIRQVETVVTEHNRGHIAVRHLRRSRAERRSKSSRRGISGVSSYGGPAVILDEL